MPDDGAQDRESLGEVLLDAEMITPRQLRTAREARRSGRTTADALIERGVVTSEDVAMALSLQLNLPLIDLNRHTVQESALELVPEELARRHSVIPLDVIDDELVIVMKNPLDLLALEDISVATEMPVRGVVGVRDEILEALDLHYRSRDELERQLDQIEPEPRLSLEERGLTPEVVARSPVTRVIELLLDQAVRDRASDVHITPDDGRLRVRYRIDGILHDVLEAPSSVHGPLVSRIKVMADMNIAERRRPQDGQFSFQGENGEVDVRVATANTARGEMAVLRILDKSLSLLRLEELGFLPDAMARYEQLHSLPFGMILVSGPTGAGKTTTLYATINRLDRKANNIVTIEDPVEYQFEGINQIQVNREAGIVFASGLRAIMRLDPDVILVGEIRDQETAEIAVQAALTGHLVLSSIHANDAVGVIHRLIDLGVPRYLVVSALVGVIAQRLARRVCEKCRTEVDITPADRMAIEKALGEAPDHVYRGQGCNSCAGTGYRGRTGVFEVLAMSDPIRRLIMEEASASEIRAKAVAEGMVPMERDGMLKVREGVTTVDEVTRNVYTIQ